MEGRTLPIGIQSLGEIRRMDCHYVDKTAHVLRLTREGKYHFPSRPRRFGKSLPVDTLKELFEGNGELFQGLPCLPWEGRNKPAADGEHEQRRATPLPLFFGNSVATLPPLKHRPPSLHFGPDGVKYE